MSTKDVIIHKTVFDIFVDGARKGWNMCVSNIIPNVLMAFVITQALQTSGLLNLIGRALGPFMNFFGLPGEACAVLLATWLSAGGGAGVAAKLYADGVLNEAHLCILLPAIFLMGAQLQYMGRCLGTAGVNPRYFVGMMLISLINAFLGMLTMRFLIMLY